MLVHVYTIRQLAYNLKTSLNEIFDIFSGIKTNDDFFGETLNTNPYNCYRVIHIIATVTHINMFLKTKAQKCLYTTYDNIHTNTK